MNTSHRPRDLMHRDPYGVTFAGLLMLLFLLFALASVFHLLKKGQCSLSGANLHQSHSIVFIPFIVSVGREIP